jgi:hypothetical protein
MLQLYREREFGPSVIMSRNNLTSQQLGNFTEPVVDLVKLFPISMESFPPGLVGGKLLMLPQNIKFENSWARSQ